MHVQKFAMPIYWDLGNLISHFQMITPPLKDAEANLPDELTKMLKLNGANYAMKEIDELNSRTYAWIGELVHEIDVSDKYLN